MLPIIELNIINNADLGDGVGYFENKPIFVPFSCAGDVLQVQITKQDKDFSRGEIVQILSASEQRQTPPCEHFAMCGGCSLQHLSAPVYANLKRGALQRIIKKQTGSDNNVTKLFSVGVGARRRAEFRIVVEKQSVVIGFSQANSHKIVEINKCLVLEPKIVVFIKELQKCLASMKKPSNFWQLSVSYVNDGLDVALHIKANCSAADAQILQEFAKNPSITRLVCICGDKIQIIKNNDVHINLADIAVKLPVGAFLQASSAAQVFIISLIKKYLADCRNIADIYSGCGTYSFPLHNKNRHIHAYEGSEDMASAMHNAILQHDLADYITVSIRDLFKKPLNYNELKYFDGVVINPPRNGALPQVQQLAKSGVKKIVMVSCNLATFERDAASLYNAGYELAEATPIDQFFWSAHLELVAYFIKK